MELTFAKTSGTVIWKSKKKNGQQLTCASPLTIPETIARHISAPVPFSILKWRMKLTFDSYRCKRLLVLLTVIELVLHSLF